MFQLNDSPPSPLFSSIPIRGNCSLDDLHSRGVSPEMAQAVEAAPRGPSVCRGIPFEIDRVVLLAGQEQAVAFDPLQARWLVFLHTADLQPLAAGPAGFISPMRGEGRLNEHAADYVMLYQDGTEARAPIHLRHQIGGFTHRWGEQCFQAVPSSKPHPVRAAHEQPATDWSRSQVRVTAGDDTPWLSWLWAWENPHPEKLITGIRFEPVSGLIVILGLSAGAAVEEPLRWRSRRKAVLHLPSQVGFQPDLDEMGQLAQIQLDLGQVISAGAQTIYPDGDWEATYNNQIPSASSHNILLEYTSHPEACFHLWDGSLIPVEQVESGAVESLLQSVPPALQRVTLRVVERGSHKLVAAKLHVHGAQGEYLSPVDRHRIVNPTWFEDYSVDFANQGLHSCTYISGETVIDLPLGKVYIEVSKGFEIRPVRKVIEISPDTQEVTIEVERLLRWRERGWVTADTHVHFLSPGSALLEGAAEGVNIINLLASQWGELMTNVGDFDGRSTWSSREGGGEQEYLVRVGTENRQHVLGHISLLGYRGRIIAPMTTGGPDESALGDPVGCLLTQWARQCHRQGGLVVVPHFPNPRAEHAASIVSGEIDAIEMTSWENLYDGIDPYSLSDWYRYLNCGYQLAAVGGTDKMSADTPVGAVRTYAHLEEGQPFTYRGLDGRCPPRRDVRHLRSTARVLCRTAFPWAAASRCPPAGGTLDVTWQVASVTLPMSRVDLVVNGEIRESLEVDPQYASGQLDGACGAQRLDGSAGPRPLSR